MREIKFSKIAQIIEARIDKGDYPPNSKLPAHRVLANELDTTPATVAKAYKVLADRGLLESFVGRGSFVVGMSGLNQAIQSPEDEDEFNFSILQPCLYKNVSVLRNAYRIAGEQLTAEMIGYVENSGHEVHRQAGAEWAKHFGLEGGDSNNTLLTNGAQHALSLLINALTKPGDTIAVEELTYPGILAIASLSGRRVVGVSMDEYGILPEALDRAVVEHKLRLVVIIPSHQNPTGITMPESRRKEVAAVIEKHKIWLVEDDIYGFLNEAPVPAISNFVPERAFHISALSKVISPAMRCGYIKAPEEQVALLNAHIRTNIWLSSPINFLAATYLIESDEAYNMARIQRETAFERQCMAREIFPSVKSSGYHIWLPLPSHWKSERLAMEAKNRGVLVSSGSYFDALGNESSHVRLSLMSINNDSRLKEGLQLLKLMIDSDVTTLTPF